MAFTPNIPYYIGGNDIYSTYGIIVAGSKGVIDMPKMKDPLSYSWPDMHGVAIDLGSPVFEYKEIILECSMRADTRLAFAENLNTFMKMLLAANTRRLQITIDAAKPLVYEVYCPDGAVLNKRWSQAKQYGFFTLKLREPEPVKRVVRFTAPITASITITSVTKPVNIYWGDGTFAKDVMGTSQVRTKTFGGSGYRFAIITGDIDSITSFTSNGATIWDKLL